MVSESKNNAPISQKKKRYSPFFFIRSPTPETEEPKIESPIAYRYQETEGEANFINTDGRDMSQLVEPGGPEPGTKIYLTCLHVHCTYSTIILLIVIHVPDKGLCPFESRHRVVLPRNRIIYLCMLLFYQYVDSFLCYFFLYICMYVINLLECF